MINFRGKLSPDVRALLDRERAILPQPAAVRARALARGRAALASKRAAAPVWSGVPTRARWAAAVALLCVLSTAVGAAAYEIRVRLTRSPSVRSLGPTIAAAPAPAPAVLSPRGIKNPIDDSLAPSGRAPATRLSKADAAREELPLLRQARAAVAREDFADALPPLAEHARRFKDGSLAEEREALRVNALAGLGRTTQARRAAAAFGARFPRSVLLPAVNQMATPRSP